MTPNNPDTPIEWEALARYLTGESSGDESERIARWLEEHKADAELLAALDKVMAGLALREVSEAEVETALERVAARRDTPATDPVVARPRTTRELRFPRRTGSPWRAVTFLAAAAAVVVAARLVLQRKDRGVSPTAAAGMGTTRAYATAVGKIDSLRLPDGGHVVLGPASRLIVAAGYGERQGLREVELHGEAYFDVVHDTTRPFVVRAGDATIRDVGTSFAVRNDSGTRVQVVVTSGSVVLRSARQDSGAVLAAGDIGTVQPGGRVATEHGASTAPYLAWMRDSLVFREAPLPEVSGGLRRWYGLVLRVDDSTLARRHLTMTFSGDPIDRVLRVIGLQLGADVERRGDTAIVKPVQ